MNRRKRPPVKPADRGPAILDEQRLLGDLLRGVSRSFYLTLRVLPKDLRGPVGLAYLLARAADTIADTRTVSPDLRLTCLLKFRDQIRGPSQANVLREIGEAVAGRQDLSFERELLTVLPQAFSLLEATAEPDRGMVRGVVATLTEGMEFDLTTFPAEDSGRVAALPGYDALDRYTYLVAGCVGEFWTRISAAHTPPLAHWNLERMGEKGVRFGKALQHTNVLRDVPKDLRLGRCYLPESWLSPVGLTPYDLLDPCSGVRARPALVLGVQQALDHFSAAEEYILAIPKRCLRLRLAALWPALIGLATLSRLVRNHGWLDPEKPSRVNRRWVYRMMARSWACGRSNALIRAWIGGLRRQVQSGLLAPGGGVPAA